MLRLLNNSDETIHAALFQLRYPTTEYWLKIARKLCSSGMDASQLAARLKNLDIKPIMGGGEGVVVGKQ